MLKPRVDILGGLIGDAIGFANGSINHVPSGAVVTLHYLGRYYNPDALDAVRHGS